METNAGAVVLDASCAINIFATGRIREIAIAWANRLAISKYVLQREALFVRQYRPESTGFEKAPLDLTDLIQEGLISVVELADSREIATMVELAASIDDGEAVTASIAVCRQGSIATDDRKASSIVRKRFPETRVISTLDLLSRWACAGSVEQSELKAAMERMRIGASFIPNRRDTRYGWWSAIVEA
ncbi:MAG: hypothetical protein F4Y67_07660 [Chloroflexi bacterium]|nr:hypothetical protein [Chloroflexota bacterium]